MVVAKIHRIFLRVFLVFGVRVGFLVVGHPIRFLVLLVISLLLLELLLSQVLEIDESPQLLVDLKMELLPGQPGGNSYRYRDPEPLDLPRVLVESPVQYNILEPELLLVLPRFGPERSNRGILYRKPVLVVVYLSLLGNLHPQSQELVSILSVLNIDNLSISPFMLVKNLAVEKHQKNIKIKTN